MYHANIASSAGRFFLRPKPPVVWNIRQTLQKLSNNSPGTRAVILAGTALAAVLVIAGNLLADLLQAWLDPRTRDVQ